MLTTRSFPILRHSTSRISGTLLSGTGDNELRRGGWFLANAFVIQVRELTVEPENALITPLAPWDWRKMSKEERDEFR